MILKWKKCALPDTTKFYFDAQLSDGRFYRIVKPSNGNMYMLSICAGLAENGITPHGSVVLKETFSVNHCKNYAQYLENKANPPPKPAPKPPAPIIFSSRIDPDDCSLPYRDN